jgi:hypothetical protein
MLSEVEKVLEKLNEHEKDLKQYENGQGYYDDLSLTFWRVFVVAILHIR